MIQKNKKKLLELSRCLYDVSKFYLQDTPVDCVSLVRTWNDGKVMVMDPDTEYLESFYKRDLQAYQPDYSEHENRLGIFIQKSQNYGEKAALALSTDYCNVDTVIYYNVIQDNFVDRFYFSNRLDNTKIIDFAINNSEALKSIAKRFSAEKTSFLDDCAQYRFVLNKQQAIDIRKKKNEVEDVIFRMLNSLVYKKFKKNITKKEALILALLSVGYIAEEIAGITYLSKRTIENKLHSIRVKLNVASSLKLAILVRDSNVFYITKDFVDMYLNIRSHQFEKLLATG